MSEALLLDTQVLLWWFIEPERLSTEVHAALLDPDRPVYVSAVTAWEIATKHRLGKLPGAATLLEPFVTLLAAQGFHSLPISERHGLRAGCYTMPHRDPFDRLLAAQAELEDLTLVTADQMLQAFPCRLLW